MKTKTFPTLYGLSKNDKLKEWKIKVEAESEKLCNIITTHGYKDGELKTTVRKIKSGKSFNRANETTTYEQSVLEARSAWIRKQDMGYVEDTDDLKSTQMLPMLAHTYSKNKHKARFPAYGQPKLNGVRALCFKVGEDLEFYSRTGKLFVALKKHTKLLQELSMLMSDGDVLDGELYLHHCRFEDIVSAVKATKTEGTMPVTKLEYWVYDFPSMSKEAYRSRYIGLNNLFLRFKEKLPKYVKLIPNKRVESHEDFIKRYESWVGEGYEGAMFKHMDATYLANYRSYDMLKHKDFMDKEFKVVGAQLNQDGGITWMCKSPYATNPRDEVFGAVMATDKVTASQMFENVKQYYGRMLTVRFLELSKQGKPIGNTVGLWFRNYE